MHGMRQPTQEPSAWPNTRLKELHLEHLVFAPYAAHIGSSRGGGGVSQCGAGVLQRKAMAEGVKPGNSTVSAHICATHTPTQQLVSAIS